MNEKEIIINSIKISNPDKIIYEGITKLDIVKYYQAVSDRMLPFLNKRLLSVIRCHQGISDACFFKKHPTGNSEGKKTVPIVNSEGKESDYFYIENLNGLVSEVQLGTIEFHLWASRIDKIDSPDIMVFDLDPDEGINLEQVRQGVLDLKDILDKLKLKSFLKTSGGKGYHIVVPFKLSKTYDEFYEFSKQIALVLENKFPKLYTVNSRKENRKGKIFIDYMRNSKGATSVAPYSLRARKNAPVSMPISFNELEKIAPDSIKFNDAIKLIDKKDPWDTFFI